MSSFLDQLADVKAKAEKATPGPWRSVTDGQWHYGVFGGESCVRHVHNPGGSTETSSYTDRIALTQITPAHTYGDGGRNMDFIAAANPAFMREFIRRFEVAWGKLNEIAASEKVEPLASLWATEAIAEIEKPWGGGK